MDTERYERLADVYGADIGRWPQDERDAALAWRGRDPEAARQVLAPAAALDRALDAWSPPVVSAALRGRVLASAPPLRPARRGFGFWLTGAGLAAAGVAGVIVGIAGSSAAVSNARADEILAAATTDDAGAAFTLLTVSGRPVPGRSA
ncbi:MAG TPA: hypothetical protein VL460_06720 [Caulobacteraceae bacterium]|jgi:hypothetical protein|nr:hypothetical protein [Caulobacteraceae bacterium]